MLPHVLRALYRREPVSSFICITGAVDLALGAMSEQWSLFSLGLGMVGVAIALRLRNQDSSSQNQQPPWATPNPPRYLPPSQRNPLPKLETSDQENNNPG